MAAVDIFDLESALLDVAYALKTGALTLEDLLAGRYTESGPFRIDVRRAGEETSGMEKRVAAAEKERDTYRQICFIMFGAFTLALFGFLGELFKWWR